MDQAPLQQQQLLLLMVQGFSCDATLLRRPRCGKAMKQSKNVIRHHQLVWLT